jgi:hypothetical protein
MNQPPLHTQVLDEFPDSKFFLVGDSGEQDLELYSTLAAERADKHQILGIFIRDVTASNASKNVGPDVPYSYQPRAATPTPPVPDTGADRPSLHPRSITSPALPPANTITRFDPGTGLRVHVPPARSATLPPNPAPSLDMSSNARPPMRPRHSSVSKGVDPGNVQQEAQAQRASDGLRERIEKARMIVPSNVALRIFRDPKECVEADEILSRLGVKL